MKSSDMVMEQYLGIDWGKRKVGVALADGETRIAFAHAVLPNDARLTDALARLVATHGVTQVVVGVPSHAAHANDGAAAREFVATFMAALPSVSVVMIDEMFTTTMAQSGRREAGKRGGDDDADAARILLQGWLDAAMHTAYDAT